MQFVIYDHESLEPITVLNLKGFTERDIERHGRHYRVPVPEPFITTPMTNGEIAARGITSMRVIDLEFEPFVRGGYGRPEQRSWMCFTKAAELAMLLNPAWLPGQRSAVNYLQDQNDKLTSMLIRAMS